MACRFFILTLVLWAGRARGSSDSDVTASCCASYRQQRWDEYSRCVNSHGIVPVCDGSRRGCYYGNRFYTAGESVAVIPEKCLKLVCSCVTVHNQDAKDQDHLHATDEGQLIADNSRTVQMQIVHVSRGCGCCEHNGQLYPNRTVLNLDRSKCDVSICIDGKWTKEIHEEDGSSTDYYYNYRRKDDGGRSEDLDSNAGLNNMGSMRARMNLRQGDSVQDCRERCSNGSLLCLEKCGKDNYLLCVDECFTNADECIEACDDNERKARDRLPKPSFHDQDLPLHENFVGREKMEARRDQEGDCSSELHDCKTNCTNDSRYNGDCQSKCQSEFESCVNKSKRSDDNRKRYWYPRQGPRHHTCCYYKGEYYVEGETIALYNESYGRNCRKTFCYRGYVRTWYYSCCCIEDNEIYSCYDHRPLPSSYHKTCSIRKCCDGYIETHHEPGCCLVNDRVYKPKQVVGYTPDYCQRKRCVEGEVVFEDTGNCCKDDGKYYRYGEVVELNAEKCILKICYWRENIIDYSVDSCPCCFYNNRLYTNGSYIYPSQCASLQCVNGTWVDDCLYTSNCDYCIVGSFYKTFDDVVYHYDGHCNSTLVARYYSYYHYSSYYQISVSFKRCSVPFSDARSCNHILTIKHSWNTAVTLHPGGRVEVNGNPVTDLPYIGNYDLFIYETAFSIRVITFYDLVVDYGKGYNPDIRISAPSWAKYRNLRGLCGAYDGSKIGDLRPRYSYWYYSSSLDYFFNSWKVNDASCDDDYGHGRDCSSLSTYELNRVNRSCTEIFEKYQCSGAYLNNTAYEEACVRYVCACLPCNEYKCYLYLISDYGKDCAELGGVLNVDCEEGPSFSIHRSSSTVYSTSEYWTSSSSFLSTETTTAPPTTTTTKPSATLTTISSSTRATIPPSPSVTTIPPSPITTILTPTVTTIPPSSSKTTPPASPTITTPPVSTETTIQPSLTTATIPLSPTITTIPSSPTTTIIPASSTITIISSLPTITTTPQ